MSPSLATLIITSQRPQPPQHRLWDWPGDRAASVCPGPPAGPATRGPARPSGRGAVRPR